MLFQSSVPALFSQMGASLYSSANTARKQDAARRLDFYHDAQIERLEEQLSQLFSEPESMVKVCLNIVKKVVKQTAQCYREPPIRTLEGGSKKDGELYKEIIERCGFDVKMKAASRYTKLLKTILLRPVWRNNAIDLDILTGNLLDVSCGESPEVLEQVLVTDFGTSDKIEDIEYSLWTPETFTRLDYRGHAIEEQKNPYKILPFLPVFDYPPASSSFWLPGGQDLMSLQEAINIKLTDLLYLIQQQSFGVGFIKGSQTGASLKVSPGTLVELPENGSIGFISQQAEVKAVVDSIDWLVKMACVSNGLSAASMSTDPQEQSGIAKQWDNKELSEMRQDDLINFRSVEKKLFDLIRVVNNYYAPRAKISDAARLRVDFADPTKQSLSAKDQATADDLRLAQGVITPCDLLLRDNPDFQGDRARAMAHLLQLKEETKLLID